MDEKHTDMLEKILDLERDNNELLKKIRTYQKRAFASKLIYWILIALVLLGGYYYVRPFLQKIHLIKQEGQDRVDEFINNIPQVKSIERQLNSLEGQFQEGEENLN